jgi:serine/threonine protein kinase
MSSVVNKNDSCLTQYNKKRQYGINNLTLISKLKYNKFLIDKTQNNNLNTDYVRPQSTNPNYEINYDGGIIQAGSFGKIYRAIEISTGLNLAAKVINKHIQKDEQTERENFIMDCLKEKEYIIPKIYSAEDENFLIIYMLYMQGGDVFSYLNKFEFFDECLSFFIFYQVLEALNTLHLNKINHRDIKLENVVFDNESDMNCYLLDFGLSEFWKNAEDPSSYSRGGSIRYAAPEIFVSNTNEPINGMKVDYFSLGVFLYLMVTGVYPFFNDNKKNKKNIVNSNANANTDATNANANANVLSLKNISNLNNNILSLNNISNFNNNVSSYGTIPNNVSSYNTIPNFNNNVSSYSTIPNFNINDGDNEDNNEDNDDNEDDVRQAYSLMISKRMYGIDRFNKLDENLQILLLNLLSPNPYSRYSYNNIIKNPWYIFQKNKFQSQGCPKQKEKIINGKLIKTSSYIPKKFLNN